MTSLINLLDYHFGVFVGHQFHHSSEVHMYKRTLEKCV